MVWNVETTGGNPESEAELELEALPLSRLVVEFLHPLETDSTVAMLALLSSPGLSRPGLFGIRLPRRGMTPASKVNLVKAGDEDDDSPFGALEKVLIGWLLTLESSRSL